MFVWKRKRSSLITFLFLFTAGCQSLAGDGFDDGHQWIFPRPAAEIQLSVVDGAGAPVAGAEGEVHFGSEPIQSVERFIAYDPALGVQSDADGLIRLRYLGDEGGGFEVPLDAPAQPKLTLSISAPGFAATVVDLDRLLYRADFRTGETNVQVAGESVRLIVVADTVVLE